MVFGGQQKKGVGLLLRTLRCFSRDCVEIKSWLPCHFLLKTYRSCKLMEYLIVSNHWLPIRVFQKRHFEKKMKRPPLHVTGG